MHGVDGGQQQWFGPGPIFLQWVTLIAQPPIGQSPSPLGQANSSSLQWTGDVNVTPMMHGFARAVGNKPSSANDQLYGSKPFTFVVRFWSFTTYNPQT